MTCGPGHLISLLKMFEWYLTVPQEYMCSAQGMLVAAGSAAAAKELLVCYCIPTQNSHKPLPSVGKTIGLLLSPYTFFSTSLTLPSLNEE